MDKSVPGHENITVVAPVGAPTVLHQPVVLNSSGVYSESRNFKNRNPDPDQTFKKSSSG